jgi:hypothetical protein
MQFAGSKQKRVRQVNEKGHIGIVEKAKFRDGYANVLS